MWRKDPLRIFPDWRALGRPATIDASRQNVSRCPLTRAADNREEREAQADRIIGRFVSWCSIAIAVERGTSGKFNS